MMTYIHTAFRCHVLRRMSEDQPRVYELNHPLFISGETRIYVAHGYVTAPFFRSVHNPFCCLLEILLHRMHVSAGQP